MRPHLTATLFWIKLAGSFLPLTGRQNQLHRQVRVRDNLQVFDADIQRNVVLGVGSAKRFNRAAFGAPLIAGCPAFRMASTAPNTIDHEGKSLTLCPHECGRFLVPPAGATDHLAVGSRSPPVPKRLGSRVPHGTTPRSLLERARQDVARRVVVSVQDQAAPRTDMAAHRQALVDSPPTAR